MIPSPIAIRILTRLARSVPLRMLRAVARVAGSAASYVVTARRRTVLESLSYLRPELTEAERRRLARHTFGNLAVAAVDLCRVPGASRDEIRSLLACPTIGNLDEACEIAKRANTGVIIVTAHIGPYELGGIWLATFGYPVTAMVEKLQPQVLEALASFRSATGMKLLETGGGVISVVRLLDRNEIVILVADRAVGDAKSAMDVPFGEGVRTVPMGPAVLSIRTGAPIVIGYVTTNRAPGPRYVVTFAPPLVPPTVAPDERPAAIQELTRELTRQLARLAREYVDEWYVFQPGWKSADRTTHALQPQDPRPA